MPHAIDIFRLPVASLAAVAIYVFLLVTAAISDALSLRIPNWLTGALALAFPCAALLARHPVGWLSHITAGLAVFVAAAALFLLRFLGGGDAKLLAATALWVGFGQMPSFLLLVAVVGGVFALVMLMLRHPAAHMMLLMTVRRVPAVAEKNAPIPYGVPIALAGIMMLPALPLFA